MKMENAMDHLNKKNEQTPNTVARRTFLIGAGAAAVASAWWFAHQREPVHANTSAADLPPMVTIVEFSDSGMRL